MTVTLTEKHNSFYVIVRKQVMNKQEVKWISLGLPVKNNKRKALKMMDEILQKEKEAEERSSVPLFTDYIRQWLINKKPFVALSTWEGYKTYAEKHIIPYFEPAGLKIDEVKPIHIRDYYNFALINGSKDGGELSRASVKKHAIVINCVFNDALIECIVQSNPAASVKIPQKQERKKGKVFLTLDEANKMLKAFDNHPLKELVYVTLVYGLRRSEVLGLKWSSIDFDSNTLSINHTVVRNITTVYKDSTKTESSNRSFRLISDVKQILLGIKETQEQNKKYFGNEYFESDYVFTWPDGSLLKPDYVTKSFQKQLRKTGFRNMRFHDLRHSTASILYDKGWNIKDIQLWLGHSSIDVTADIYTHISNDRKQKMADELNSTFIFGGN